jgi:polar amino acid transport system substrate-binding protein
MRHLTIITLAVSLLLTGCSQGGAKSLSTSSISRASTLNKIVTRGELRVGFESGYVPFEMKTSSGEYIGFDVDMARMMAKELGVKLKMVDTAWDGIIPSLMTNKFDMIVGGMTITLQRAKTINFSDPYFRTGQAILIPKSKIGKFKSHNDLNKKGIVIATKQGTTGDIAAEKHLKNAKIKKFESEADAANEVRLGRADGFVYDQPFIAHFSKINSDRTGALLDPFTFEDLGVGIRPGDVDLLNWTNHFIRQIKADGRWEALYQTYFVTMPWLSKLTSKK